MAKKEELKEAAPEPVDDKTELKQKVEDKIDKVEDKIEKKTGKRENLIGELADPKVDDDFDFKSWSKSVDAKIDKLLGHHEKKESAPEPTSEPQKDEKPLPWYERELF